MKKSEVLGYFGGVVKTAAALGTSKTTVSMGKRFRGNGRC